MKKFCSYARPSAMTGLVLLFGMCISSLMSADCLMCRNGISDEIRLLDGQGSC